MTQYTQEEINANIEKKNLAAATAKWGEYAEVIMAVDKYAQLYEDYRKPYADPRPTVENLQKAQQDICMIVGSFSPPLMHLPNDDLQAAKLFGIEGWSNQSRTHFLEGARSVLQRSLGKPSDEWHDRQEKMRRHGWRAPYPQEFTTEDLPYLTLRLLDLVKSKTNFLQTPIGELINIVDRLASNAQRDLETSYSSSFKLPPIQQPAPLSPREEGELHRAFVIQDSYKKVRQAETETLLQSQLIGLMEGEGAGEDHEDVKKALASIGLDQDAVNLVHATLCNSQRKAKIAPIVRDWAFDTEDVMAELKAVELEYTKTQGITPGPVMFHHVERVKSMIFDTWSAHKEEIWEALTLARLQENRAPLYLPLEARDMAKAEEAAGRIHPHAHPDNVQTYIQMFFAGLEWARGAGGLHSPHSPEAAAICTLTHLGYTHSGGVMWRPPLGEVPAYIKPISEEDKATLLHLIETQMQGPMTVVPQDQILDLERILGPQKNPQVSYHSWREICLMYDAQRSLFRDSLKYLINKAAAYVSSPDDQSKGEFTEALDYAKKSLESVPKLPTWKDGPVVTEAQALAHLQRQGAYYGYYNITPTKFLLQLITSAANLTPENFKEEWRVCNHPAWPDPLPCSNAKEALEAAWGSLEAAQSAAFEQNGVPAEKRPFIARELRGGRVDYKDGWSLGTLVLSVKGDIEQAKKMEATKYV